MLKIRPPDFKVKAYGSVRDNVKNVAKDAAKIPAANFAEVVPTQLGKQKYKTMIIQSGSTDITNLNTKENPEEHIEYFKDVAIESATNLFLVVTNELKTHPSLRKVVIMKQIPRYDPPHIDPLAIKPNLSELFNNTLTKLWMDLDPTMKKKIFIGNHNIECSGAIREARYRETRSGRYDGVHLYGPSGQKTFTQSVLNILRAAGVTSDEHNFHLSCEQTKYQQHNWRTIRNVKRQHLPVNKRYIRPQEQHQFTPVYNRYSILSGRQGNW